MAHLAGEGLAGWVSSFEPAPEPVTVTVLNPGNIPMVGLQDWLAVVFMGHHYAGVLSSRDALLLPAFVKDVASILDEPMGQFCGLEQALTLSKAVIASGSDETMEQIQQRCHQQGIPASNQLLRGHRFSLAVLDGSESDDELVALAEDMLLHEGLGCRSVVLLWAPELLEPDAVLDALAVFRGTFPAHSESAGSLRMQQAFLAATAQSHAYGEGLEFLVSKGPPEVQSPLHIRWSIYENYDEVVQWINAHAPQIQLVISKSPLSTNPGIPVLPPGSAQRPRLGWKPDGKDILEFLSQLQT